MCRSNKTTNAMSTYQQYDVDVFENVSSNGKAYLSVLLKDVWVKDNPSPVAEESSETDF